MTLAKQRLARAPRVRKRLAIRFGSGDARGSSGFTTNLSPRGLGIMSYAVLPYGTKVSIEFVLPGGNTCQLEGVVVWAKQGAAQFRAPGTMGLRVTWADEDFFQFVAHLLRADVPTPPEPRPALQPLPPPIPRRSVITIPPPVPRAANSIPPEAPVPEPVAATLAPAPVPEHAAEPASWFEAAEDISPSTPAPAPAESSSLLDRAPRHAEQLPIRFGADEELRFKGFTINLSRTGFALLTREPLSSQDRVRVEITSPDGTRTSGTGSVVWTRQQRSHIMAGVQLEYVDIGYDELLDTLAQGWLAEP